MKSYQWCTEETRKILGRIGGNKAPGLDCWEFEVGSEEAEVYYLLNEKVLLSKPNNLLRDAAI